jgi:DNA-binding MarR family transcriptional regulator
VGNGINRFDRGISYIREQLNGDFALPQLAIFLLVARNEDITMVEIGERLNMPQGTVSRNVKALSKYHTREGNKVNTHGYDLLKVEPDLFDRRKFAVTLTTKGKEIKNILDDLLSTDE